MKNQKPRVHLIGNAHLDPVWLWRWQEGYAEIKATFQSALDRIDQFDDFIFTTACAAYYQWIEESEPEMFEKIKAAVKAGKWCVVGGQWIQPDCNIPSGESFARHALYSQRYFEKKLGVKAKVGYNVDSFGHNGNLPQLYHKSGIEAYIMMRPHNGAEKQYPFADGIPFLWEGIDGTRLPTFHIPTRYGSDINENELKIIEDIAVKSGRSESMAFFGVGNHGGGPTISNIERLHKAQEEDRPVEYIISTPDQYFDEVMKKAECEPLPVLTGDLQHHASGCYSTHTETKYLNRKSEQTLMAAEKCAVLANRKLGLKYDNLRLEKAWEKVLFNQFHDIMGGCSIKPAYSDSRDFYGEALTIASETYNMALQKISWAIDTDKGVRFLSKDNDWKLWEIENKGVPVVVYNPLSWPVRATVQINRKDLAGLTDETGGGKLFQKVRGPQLNSSGDASNVIFQADLPAMGYRTYWAYLNEAKPGEKPLPLRATEFYMENNFIRIEFDHKTGFLKSIYDKVSGLELLAGAGAKPVVVDETELDTWAHNVFTFRNDIGAFEKTEIRVIETGPVRAKVMVRSAYGSASELTQMFTLYADGRDIEVDAKLFWKEKHKLLKLAFETKAVDSKAVFEIPYGFITKRSDGKEQPAQCWAAVEDETRGLAILNDGKYAYDVKEGEIRLTVVRGAIYADHFGGSGRDDLCDYQEQGEHEFKYIIKPYAGSFADAGVVRRAWEFNSPAVHVMETYHKGTLPQTLGGVEIDNENVILSSLKQAEEEDGVIVRLYECNGKGGDACVKLPWLGAEIKASFSPCEIKSFKIKTDGKIDEVNLIEE
ncbi:MAG TPA: glycoside hydrolase family 38 C-terminal domain-containing protein [Oscillospiraceae bacterium]|nr:glycoside hydrolase family 38 C-terminal domain-containing protein [Oscillospiraceae bacterium]HPF54981.1 glycoside hydrolase family 38 C-terminal domain-containing protein [Clostridiales bacterium]HPK34394.1 glycoside hydrolase family 38 C-terminal domain-containing protein [Oscillospiraceae bacterium]HPR76732.1 glycoside hydrolase family 38 C-terminal domain-containing protein [Oscillospiraceae bacterium]